MNMTNMNENGTFTEPGYKNMLYGTLIFTSIYAILSIVIIISVICYARHKLNQGIEPEISSFGTPRGTAYAEMGINRSIVVGGETAFQVETTGEHPFNSTKNPRSAIMDDTTYTI